MAVVARRVSSSRFVGRSPELAVFASALERSRRGEAGAVLIGGESEVGKSRLVGEFERSARCAAGALPRRRLCRSG